VELSIVLIILGILMAIVIPNYMAITNMAKESKVKENCHNVQLVVELYATGTDGVYPDANEASIVANVVPEFSGSQRLRNPYTGVRTEPVAGAAASIGQTGYRVIAPLGVNTGYIITGFGKSAIVFSQTSGQ
jgi:type II secretory pathway pseudopilin PulG